MSSREAQKSGSGLGVTKEENSGKYGDVDGWSQAVAHSTKKKKIKEDWGGQINNAILMKAIIQTKCKIPSTN